ncbi:MAG: hypothetical protein ACI97A_003755 [Planctomycetota bacterium]|jgi:uncharacterized protein YqeY
MPLREQLNAEVKTAMKAREKFRLATLRMITAMVKQFEVDKRQEPTDEDVLTMMIKAAKQRRESIDAAEKYGRTEMAENEKAELAIIGEFLPKQLTEDELVVLIEKAIADTGAASKKDMGKVMGILSSQVKGKSDGKLVAKLVSDRL